jgi:hypothetical protein
MLSAVLNLRTATVPALKCLIQKRHQDGCQKSNTAANKTIAVTAKSFHHCRTLVNLRTTRPKIRQVPKVRRADLVYLA